MTSTPPFPTTPEQRLLAAIVFTDVVGFTRRMQTEEAKTLKLLERDFDSMRAFCAMHSGRVIKTTGDGLLLFFTSAIQAVEWSLKAQRHFEEQAEELPTAEVLKHRVGIHLGDVVLSGNDVMGDGVNVAARVMGESPPAGICISQDVYAVVKNKMKLDVLRLEPRVLKNVNEPMQMYRVLLEPPAKNAMQAKPVSAVRAADVAPPPAWRKWALLGGALVILAVAGLVLFQAQREHERELAGSQDMRAALSAAVQARSDGAAGPVSEPAGAAPVAASPTPVVVAPATPAPPPAAVIDFAKLTATRSPGAPSTEEEKRVVQSATDAVNTLLAWTPGALRRYTKDNPLFVRPLRNGSFQPNTVYMDARGKVCFAEGGAVRPRNWEDLSVAVQGAIVAALIRNFPATPPEIVRGGDAFAYLNRLPEMADMLIRDRK